MFAWIKSLFALRPPVETILVPYAEGDRLLRKNEGWRLSKLEDRNRVIGVVYLERDRLPSTVEGYRQSSLPSSAGDNSGKIT